MLIAVFLKITIRSKLSDGLAIGIHGLVERGKKQVLQNGVVIGALFLTDRIQGVGDGILVKQMIGDEVFFFQEPAEDQPGQQADDAGGIAGVFLVFFCAFGVLIVEIGRKANLLACPKIPVGQFLIKTLVE